MSEAQAESGHDEGEFRYLGHGQAGQKPGAAAIAHEAHDDQHDDGVADQHESGEEDRRTNLGADRRPVQAGTQVDEEKQQQKIPQGGEASADGIPKRRGSQGNPGQKSPDLLAEPEHFAAGAEQHRPGDGKQDEQLLGLSQALQQRRQHITHEQGHQHQHAHAFDENQQGRLQHRNVSRHAAAEGGQYDQSQYGGNILHDEKTDGDLAVQGIDLLLVGEQFDDDDGTGKGQGHGHVGGMQPRQAQPQGQHQADGGGKENLPHTRGHGDGAGGTNQVQIQFQADDEQQQGNAHVGQQGDLFMAGDDAQHRRPRQNAGSQKHDDQGLAQLLADHAQQGGQTQNSGDFKKGIGGRQAHGLVVGKG